MTTETLYIGSITGQPDRKITLPLSRANRHGLIAGATGTGKTVTLQVLAEAFSAAGVPVFMADIKGDLSGICQPSAMQDFLTKRAAEIGLDPYTASAFPVIFWDMFGAQGHPVRTTISEIGPLLLARILELNDTQEGVLQVAFRAADDQGLLLLDLKDLRALLTHISESADEISREYGNVTPQSIATIQRALLKLEEQGAAHFFGEPALNLNDFLRTAYDGRGFINLLNATKLMQTPRLYATFLLWMLSELFEQLPEVGDLPKPKLVFFFDEAHLLFRDAPKSLLEKIENVVRLIRSKGVGVYFITQSPEDVPESVLGQLGHKIQHALRAFTPAQQKYIRAAAQGFRPNPAFKVEDAVQELKVGEALVSVLDESGTPSMVERVLVRPPSGKLGPADDAALQAFLQNSPVANAYTASIDRESAYEILQQKAGPARLQAEDAQKTARQSRDTARAPRASTRQGTGEALVKSIVRAAGSQIGRQITNALVRGIMGSLKK